MLRRLLLVMAMMAGSLALFATLAPAAQAAEPLRMASLAPVAPVMPCADLAKLDLAGATGAPTTFTATEVAGAKPYCQVSGTIARANRFEVRLPLGGWTQRFLQTGCGGLCGSLRIDPGKAEGCTPVTDGSIVLASTDMGHSGNGSEWGENADQRTDFAYRGVHVTTLAAKALIKAFYGQAQRYAYFSGCSDGGREALMEAQRYPQDFDGIAAGAPALNFTVQNSFHHGWLAKQNTGADGKPVLTWPDMVPLHAAVLKSCDGLDGLVDGQITDPRLCRFDPAVILCKAAYEAGKCLTATQVAVVRKIYDGARSAKGTKLEIGAEMPGSEMEWRSGFVPSTRDGRIGSEMFMTSTVNALMFTPNPKTPYSSATMPFTEAFYAAGEPARKLYSADDADISRFLAHGKLLLWHGWADPHISPMNSIDYYARVGLKAGTAQRDAAMRLFLFPGMGHCSGGDGPSEFPLLANLMAWVESGKAPGRMVAARAGQTAEGLPVGIRGAGPNGPGAGGPPLAGPGGPGGPAGPGGVQAARQGPPPGMMPPKEVLPPRSRPIFAYPQVARYSGKGSVDDAASFVAATPAPTKDVAVWIGASR